MDLILRMEYNKIWTPGKKKALALKHLPVKVREKLFDYFTQYMVDVYAEELVKAIDSQRFKRLWEDLTTRYLKHKKDMGWSTKIWEATGLLKNSITYWRVHRTPKAVAIGIKAGVLYPTETGKRLEVRKVAQWMEYGTGEQAEGGKGKNGFPGMPPRPLFRPMRDRMSKDISRYWRKFIHLYEQQIDDLLVLGTVGAL